MKIEMNKNFEDEFRVTGWKGLTTREMITGAIALLATAGVDVLLWYFTKIPINICVYAGLPIMLLIGGIGIYEYQGMTVFQLLKELKYLGKTKELASETEEYRNSNTVFSMKSSMIEEDRRRKGR